MAFFALYVFHDHILNNAELTTEERAKWRKKLLSAWGVFAPHTLALPTRSEGLGWLSNSLTAGVAGRGSQCLVLLS